MAMPNKQQLHQQFLQLQTQPHVPLAAVNGTSSTTFPMPLLSALKDAIEGPALLALIAARLARTGWVLLELGASPDTMKRAAREAKSIFPRMQPGMVVDQNSGATVEGVDPCGVPRGDRFTRLHDSDIVPGGAKEAKALFELDETLVMIAGAVGACVASEAGLPFDVTGSTDTMVAIFPGGGAQYGAHLDSNLHGGYNSGKDPRKLTCILYINEEVDGGELCLHDPENGCWHTVSPRRDSLVIFRSDRVLHRVAPSYRWRTALTVFLTGPYRDDGRANMVGMMGR